MQGRKETEALGIPRREPSKAMNTEAFSEQGGRGKVLIFDESIKHCGQAFSSNTLMEASVGKWGLEDGWCWPSSIIVLHTYFFKQEARMNQGKTLSKASHGAGRRQAHGVLNRNLPQVQLPSLFKEKICYYVLEDKGFAPLVLEECATAVI